MTPAASPTTLPVPPDSRTAPVAAVPGQRAPGVPFAVTEVCEEARAAAAEVLASGWVTTGPRTVRFEEELAAYAGARHAVSVSSCTAALELSLRALDLPVGSPVLTPTLTFCGAVHAIVHAGLRPVLVDVGAGELVPTPETTAEAAARAGKPAAMVVQHMAGQPVSVEALAAAAGLPVEYVVEDAAHAIAAEHADGRRVGSGRNATCFSFYATKNLPIGEGGAILTDDDELAARLRRTRLHGMSHDAWKRYLPGGSWQYDVAEPGLKANLTDVQAAIGSAQLAKLDAWQQRREEIVARYDERLARLGTVTLPPRPEGGRHAWHLYVIRVGAKSARDRDEVARALGERGIGTSVHFTPVHRLSWFRNLLGEDEVTACPNADAAYTEILSLPLHPQLTLEQVDRVCEAVTTATGASPDSF